LGLRPYFPLLVQFCEEVRMLLLYLGLENRQAYSSPIRVSEVEATSFTNYDCVIDQDCHGKSCIQQEEDSFCQHIGLKFEEETKKMLHLEHGFVWC